MKKKREYGGNLCTPRTISVPDDEWAAIAEMAAQAKMTTSAYVRHCFLAGIRPTPGCVQPKLEEIAQELGIPAAKVADRILLTWTARKLAWEMVHGPLDMGRLEEFTMAERIPDDAFFQFIMRESSVELRAAKLAEIEALSKSAEATEAALAKVEAKAAKGRKSA